MLAKLRPRSAYDAVALVALFVALGGGAYATTALPKNSVGTKQLEKNAVISSKIRDGGVGRADIARGAVNDSKAGPDSLTGRSIKESTLGQVPTAATASNATNADNATHATSADSATSAGDATTLAGLPVGTFQQICNHGSIVAQVYVKGSNNTTTWPASTYVTAPLRDSFNCAGASPAAQAQRMGAGIYLVDFPGVDPTGHLVATGNVTVDQSSTQDPNDILTYKLVFDATLARTVYRVEITDAGSGTQEDREFSFSVNS
jgi:hypothetical protein